MPKLLRKFKLFIISKREFKLCWYSVSAKLMARVIIIKYDKVILKWKTNMIKITTFFAGNNGVISVLSTGTRWCHDSHHRFLKASRSSPPSNRSVKVTHVLHYRCWANIDNISSQVLIESLLHWTLIPTIISFYLFYYHFLSWSSWKLSRNKNTTEPLRRIISTRLNSWTWWLAKTAICLTETREVIVYLVVSL